MKSSDGKKKKVLFEPISAEEAKKIRATMDDRNLVPPSGMECASGGDRVYDPCVGKDEGDWCCYHDYRDQYGKCYEISGEGRLRCIIGGYNKL